MCARLNDNVLSAALLPPHPRQLNTRCELCVQEDRQVDNFADYLITSVTEVIDRIGSATPEQARCRDSSPGNSIPDPHGNLDLEFQVGRTSICASQHQHLPLGSLCASVCSAGPRPQPQQQAASNGPYPHGPGMLQAQLVHLCSDTCALWGSVKTSLQCAGFGRSSSANLAGAPAPGDATPGVNRPNSAGYFAVVLLPGILHSLPLIMLSCNLQLTICLIGLSLKGPAKVHVVERRNKHDCSIYRLCLSKST